MFLLPWRKKYKSTLKYLNPECDNVRLEFGFRLPVSHKKDNSLLELTLNFQISFVLHPHEAVHILNKALPLSVWIRQLPLYAIGCKTKIDLIFGDIFKAASFCCYLIISKNYLITK